MVTFNLCEKIPPSFEGERICEGRRLRRQRGKKEECREKYSNVKKLYETVALSRLFPFFVHGINFFFLPGKPRKKKIR